MCETSLSGVSFLVIVIVLRAEVGGAGCMVHVPVHGWASS